MQRRTRPPERTGFTIVELLVAMALIVFIMYVLAEAFAAGSKAFRDLKAIGDMNARLRSATQTLRRYLSMDHFEGRKRLSDPDFWKEGPPREGFMRIWQGDGGTSEGNDLDGNPSYRTTSHHLHFAVRLRGNQRSDFFQASAPAGSPLFTLPTPGDSRFQDGTNNYHSNWAEIIVYLKPNGDNTDDPNNLTGTAQPLHTLYLRQRLLVPTHDEVPAPTPTVPNGTQYPEVSVTRNSPDDPNDTAQLYFNCPADMTMPIRRFGYAFWRTGGTRDIPVLGGNSDVAGNRSPANYPTMSDEDANLAGSDVLLTDVLSMDIRVLLDKNAYTGGAAEEFVSLFSTHVNKYVMTRATPFQGNARVFDTWSSRKDARFDYSRWDQANQEITIPMYTTAPATIRPIRIRAIQITLRIWDSKTKQSRQVSIVQDL